MKLSINQYNEIFKDRSITNYTKFNWKGDMPVLKEFVFDNVNVYVNIPFHLDPGKYVFEIINKEVTTYGPATYMDKTGIGDFMVNSEIILSQSSIDAVTGTEYIVTFKDGCDVFNLYMNEYNYANSQGYKGKIKFIIREYVENLVLTSQSLSGNIVRSGDNYKGTFTNYEPINASLLSSHLAYGDYIINCDVNELKPSTGYIWVRNATKNIELFNSGYKGTFTLTPANYSDGDTIYIYFHHNSAGGYLDITNFFVCKIKDDWIVRKGNIATWYPNGGQSCFYEIDEKGSRPKYEERTLFFKNNISSIVTEFYFDNDGNGIVYISEDMPTSDFNEMMSVVDIMYKKAQ